MRKSKKLGFGLLEVAISVIVFSLSVLILQQLVARSLQFFSFKIENILQQTQNFSAGQTLQIVPDSLEQNFVWKKNSHCSTNLAGLVCIRYEVQLFDGKIFYWYQYER